MWLDESHIEYSFQENLANDPSTPKIILNLLSQSYLAQIKFIVGRNPKISIKTLKKLIKKNGTITRMYVASNPVLPMEIAKILIVDRSFSVRMAVLNNPELTIEALLTLINNTQITPHSMLIGGIEKTKTLNKLSSLINKKRVFL